LTKARKRRAFGKLIRGIIDSNKKNNCEICGRNPDKNSVRLVCHLALKGILISGLLTAYPLDILTLYPLQGIPDIRALDSIST
jgi:hypothetical protein